MRCLGYAGGLTPPAWLDRPGTTVFTDMRELPALVAELGRDPAATPEGTR